MQMDLPNLVIEYTSRVIALAKIDKDILIKALLRRGLAYEKIDKLILGLKDYENVKHLHPEN